MRFALACAVLLLAAACKSKSSLEREEARGKDKAVEKAQDRVHELKMKELGGTELSPEEAAERDRLKAQADEELNGGNTPLPPPPPPEEAPAAEGT